MSHTQTPPAPTATGVTTAAPLATDSAEHTSQDEDETSESDRETGTARPGGRGAESAAVRSGGGGGGGASASYGRGRGGVRLAKGNVSDCRCCLRGWWGDFAYDTCCCQCERRKEKVAACMSSVDESVLSVRPSVCECVSARACVRARVCVCVSTLCVCGVLCV